MKKNLFLGFAAFTALFFSVSCENDLITSPIGNPVSVSAKNVSVPQDFTATHGGVGQIELNWKSVENVRQYKIYAAATPFSEYRQITEALGEETSVIYSAASGVVKYFKIKAINNSGIESDFSTAISGSTMASPFITSITSSEDGTEVSLSWWMENCTPETYENLIVFEISAYAEDQTTVVSTVMAQGSDRSCVLKGLSPKTKYYFQIESYLSSNQDSVEKSDLLDIETARRVMPAAPVDFSASQGSDSSKVELSWLLPEYCDVSAGSGIYERHPLYFTLFRKEAGASDSDYVELASYIGSVREGKTSEKVYNFDCLTETASDSCISVQKSQETDSEISGDYKYASLSKISFIDTTAEKMKQYVYKLQSYVDDTKKTISSPACIVCAEGWLINIPVLQVKHDYYLNEDSTRYTSIDFKFLLNFENFSKKYSYIIKETKTDFADETNKTGKKWIFTSAAGVSSMVRNFADPLAEEGYYNYQIFICEEGVEDVDQAIVSADAAGTFVVTDDPTKTPVIESFTVEDGYSSKYVLNFSYDSSYTYTVHWWDITENGQQEEQTLELKAEDLTIDASDSENVSVQYEHDAVSGEGRIYQLSASNGLEGTKDPDDSPEDKIFRTLGTAKIIPTEKEYNSIQFSWDKVQKADEGFEAGYELKLYYADDETKTSFAESGLVTSGENFSFNLENYADFKDAEKSGKAITVEITSKNAKDQTKAYATVSTMGPAAASGKVTDSREKEISVSWDKVDNAVGYIVARVFHSDSAGILMAESEDIDHYYVSAQDLSVEVSNSAVSEERVTVTETDGKFILKDKYSPAGDDAAQAKYQARQEKLSWGLPYSYLVVPVKSKDDFTFTWEQSENKIKAEPSSKVEYTNILNAAVKGAAFGYGLNLKASKATSAKTVTVSWTQPFNRNQTPVLYRRLSGSNGKWEYVAQVTKSSAAEVSNDVIIKAEDLLASYEYSVSYSASRSTFDFADSFEEILTNSVDVNNEQDNKGYVLSLRNNISAEYVSGYTEKFSWIPYDYEERAVGPDWYEVQINNVNSSKGWTAVARINVDLTKIDGAFKDKGDYAVLENAESTKVKMVNADENGKSEIHNLQLEPVFDATDVNVANVDGGSYTTGALKVLRDAKHYYRLVAKRTFKLSEDSDEITISASTGDDMSVWAYRQITDEELAKAAMLAVSYAFYLHDGGKADLSNVADQLKYGGTSDVKSATGDGKAIFKKATYQLNTKYKGSYSFSDYIPEMRTPGNTYASFLKLNSSEYSVWIRGLSDHFLYYLEGNETIKISLGNGDLENIDCSAEVTFNCPGTNELTLSINRSGVTKNLVSTKDNETRKRWFPMQLHDNKGYEFDSVDYGWWED